MDELFSSGLTIILDNEGHVQLYLGGIPLIIDSRNLGLTSPIYIYYCYIITDIIVFNYYRYYYYYIYLFGSRWSQYGKVFFLVERV